MSFPERKLKTPLTQHANLNEHDIILGFGIGKGSLALMICKQFPNIQIIGIDADERVLEMPEKKIYLALRTSIITVSICLFRITHLIKFYALWYSIIFQLKAKK